MKKKMVNAMALILAAASVMSGCGSSGSSEAGSSGSAVNSSQKGKYATSSVFNGKLEKNQTIQVLENDTAISEGYFDELINAFNEKYKKYGIKAVDANMDQYLDLANDGPYGYGPDVLYQANDVIMQYAEGKHIYPLPVEQLECYSQIPESAWKAYETEQNGKKHCCGVPMNVQAPMLYYRKDLLPDDWKDKWDSNQNDIPDMVENWNDMYKFSLERHQENSKQYGYMKSIYDVYFSSGYLFSYGGYIFGKNNTDTDDIGFAAGDSVKGANVLEQLASTMNEECIDDTITTNAYSKIADGTYFATMTTPDVYQTFINELVNEYVAKGETKDQAEKDAKENLVMTTLPQLPESGDLTDDESKKIDMKSMGGINGYAVSAYTKCPNDCLAFVDFATSYKMAVKRSKMLGVAPAREDAAKDCGGISEMLYKEMEDNQIVLMPSNKEVAQIWTPAQTFFTDLAKDAFRSKNQKKYPDEASMKKGLEQVDKQIYDAIHTLK
jgi:arabinogalactan oligomer/maltooligosaccharide transport system substrate-binding protein